MTSLEEIINAIFGGQVSLDKVLSIVVAVYAVVKSITEWIAKRKLIQASANESALLKELKLARAQNVDIGKAVGKLADIVLTSYLSSNTIPVEVKREIGVFGSELNKIADVPLAETTQKIIDVVNVVIPNNDLIQHQEEIAEATKLAEEVIDNANDVAQDAIDKISI